MLRRYLRFRISLVILFLLLAGCAKETIHSSRSAIGVSAFRAMAYITAERRGIKWASNVAVLVKEPGSVRLDALERVTDVVATLVAGEDGGVLHLPLTDEWRVFGREEIILPKVGGVNITSVALAGLLVGRFEPPVGGRRVTYDAVFDDFSIISGKKIPRHIVIRFRHPKMIVDIRYKDIEIGVAIPDALMKMR